jgi:hypothetical protein
MSQSWYETGMLGLGTDGNGGTPVMVIDYYKMGAGTLIAGGVGAGAAHLLGHDLKVGGGVGAALALLVMGAINYKAVQTPFVAPGLAVTTGGASLPGDAVPRNDNGNGAVAGCGACGCC